MSTGNHFSIQRLANARFRCWTESYQYAVETSDGTKKEEAGTLKDAGSDHEGIDVHGSYSWTDEKTGEKFTVEYVANENGFQPKGAHLPVAPVAP
ncbi:unnamed protein product [Ceratitis capitata]|uniref:(Mediterranean fruit fly) hypothetical protein n=1 Tax=Ceratitis capitata TaxID=7213 RepID=A0A811V3R5_CERCA|nr:unnamed protein product [Ceratitis capitata]